MNKENYKAIAEIMSHGYSWTITCKKLADCFERKDKENHYPCESLMTFDRKQFLKDCGVEE